MKKSNKAQIQIGGIIVLFVILIIVAVFFVIPGVFKGVEEYEVNFSPEKTSKEVIPVKILEYSKVETDEFIRKATAVGVGATVTVTTGNVNKAFTIAKITDETLQCYQDAGAYATNGFYKIRDPIRAGFIVVGDSKNLKDPSLHYKCIKKAVTTQGFTIAGMELTPCVKRFKLISDTNMFYVLITGTDTPVCETIKQYTLS